MEFINFMKKANDIHLEYENDIDKINEIKIKFHKRVNIILYYCYDYEFGKHYRGAIYSINNKLFYGYGPANDSYVLINNTYFLDKYKSGNKRDLLNLNGKLVYSYKPSNNSKYYKYINNINNIYNDLYYIYNAKYVCVSLFYKHSTKIIFSYKNNKCYIKNINPGCKPIKIIKLYNYKIFYN